MTKVKQKKGKSAFLKEGYGKPCCYCRRIMISPNCEEAIDDPGRVASIEHKIYPRSKGGDNSLYNIDKSCRRCNQLRGNVPYEIFEPFARIVVCKFRDYPYAILLSALKNHITRLAEIGAKNEKAANNAILASMIEVEQQMRGH